MEPSERGTLPIYMGVGVVPPTYERGEERASRRSRRNNGTKERRRQYRNLYLQERGESGYFREKRSLLRRRPSSSHPKKKFLPRNRKTNLFVTGECYLPFPREEQNLRELKNRILLYNGGREISSLQRRVETDGITFVLTSLDKVKSNHSKKGQQPISWGSISLF